MKTGKIPRKHSLWLYYGLSVAIAVAALLSVTWYVADRFRDFFIDQLKITLEARAHGIADDIHRDGLKTARLTARCLSLKRTDPRIRVTLIDDRGVVLCDSDADPAGLENHR